MTLSRKRRSKYRLFSFRIPSRRLNQACKQQTAQMLPIMAIFLGLSASVLVVVSALGDRAARIAQADAVADAVALAAVSGGEAEANAVARANDYELLSLRWEAAGALDPPLSQSLSEQESSSEFQKSANRNRTYCKVEAKVRESARSATQGRSLFGGIFSRPFISSAASAAGPCPAQA